ncbi:helix-turn-helix transcriptional regulator [Nonomuraea wenchangensis]
MSAAASIPGPSASAGATAAPGVVTAGASVPSGRDSAATEGPETNIALRIEYEMRRRGWSQERLSKEMADAGCPIHQSSISKILNPRGKRRTISVDEAVAFAKVFGTTLDDVLLPLGVAQGQEVHLLVEEVSTTLFEKAERVEREMRAWDRLSELLSDREVMDSYEAWLQQVMGMTADQAKQALRSWQIRTRHVFDYYTETLIHAQEAADKELRATVPGPHAPLSSLVRARRGLLAIPEVAERSVFRQWMKTYVRYLAEARMSDLIAELLRRTPEGRPVPAEPVQACLAEIDRQIAEMAEMPALSSDDELQRLGARAAPAYWAHEPMQDIAARLGATVERLVAALRRGALLEETEA